MMTSGGRNGIECAVIIKRDGCLLVIYVTEEANRKEILSRLERREAQLGATIIGGNSPSVVRWSARRHRPVAITSNQVLTSLS